MSDEIPIPEDMVAESPIPCQFKVGDEVIFTNDNGIEFRLKVRGFASPPHNKRFVYVFTDAWWFPTDPAQLSFLIPSWTNQTPEW